MNSEIVFETPRLLFREFEMSDAQQMFELNNDPEVIRYTGDGAFKSVEEAEKFISTYLQYETHGFGRWTVLLKETSEYLGWCGLRFHEDIKEVDLGYRFHRKHWGRGYATESSTSALKAGFENFGLKKIIARALKENLASIKVLEKIGMHFQSELMLHGAPAVVYGITAEEFFSAADFQIGTD